MVESALNIQICTEIAAISASEWDAIAGKENPFLSHSFLAALEAGGAVGGNSGWEAMHLLLRADDGQLLGAMPHYLKHHSYGNIFLTMAGLTRLNALAVTITQNCWEPFLSHRLAVPGC